MKSGLEKRLTSEQGVTQKPLTSLEFIPAVICSENGKSPGNPVVELTTPKGTINLSEGTNKN
ncbi:MAG: hypothetical protein HWQ23_32745 [Nostoc sp. JL33]|uniref:hypothetical protein n=1 Tax=Nostoc sp. JL33 TaxID=2815396 RepID=UPI0025DCDDF1|nr:hypothetical protein [Nostoc sp. JL33]MBN3874874.1 hypothetical protein [Nostoc sp. JL33]